MIAFNLRRFPGFVYRFGFRSGAVAMFGLTVIVYLMHRRRYACTNDGADGDIDRLCDLYERGEAVGNLCRPLCLEKEIQAVTCISRSSSKKVVFTAKWNRRLIVVKSAIDIAERPIDFDRSKSGKSGSERKAETVSVTFSGWKEEPGKTDGDDGEEQMEKDIRNLVVERLNMTLTRDQLDSLRYLESRSKSESSSGERKAERKNIFELLRSQEYLFSRLFSDRDVFPQVLGTCGHLYGVEHLESPNFDSVFALDDKAEWSDRMKLAVAIMDFVEEVETNFPDALHFCDVEMNHLGVTKSGRIKFLDSSLVFTKNVVDRRLKSGRKCREHEDCDLFDCRSFCDSAKKICDSGVANDNLQAICEKIFIGWRMSGKMIIPGLLMSEHTPASLSALLRLCAENGRRPVPEDLRHRLYTILTEMHQILTQRLLPE